jgi:hypothetical protein
MKKIITLAALLLTAPAYAGLQYVPSTGLHDPSATMDVGYRIQENYGGNYTIYYDDGRTVNCYRQYGGGVSCY